MHTPLNASATTAGALFSGSVFEVPRFQREYAWTKEEIQEFWMDLHGSLHLDTYFLGLVILTDDDGHKHVVDGQQRLITLTLLASAIFHKANELGRKALADRVQADFLKSIDYETDAETQRLILSDSGDNRALQAIVRDGDTSQLSEALKQGGLNSDIPSSYETLRQHLDQDIATDPFKRLGSWADFITNKLYFAVFVHPDPASAYRVFEVINTRGVELTTADLLKNYLLSQVPATTRESMYEDWQRLANQIESVGEQSFVQYIRHVVTSHRGHILPKDLFDFLARRHDFASKRPLSPIELVSALGDSLELYVQMMDPRLEGPAEPEAISVFAALNDLSVIAVRPILLSLAQRSDSIEGMHSILRLVVRRIVVGNLGTGNIERRFGEVAKLVKEVADWRTALAELEDLNPSVDEFEDRLQTRSFNKKVLSFLRRSIIEKTITPSNTGTLHLIRPRNADKACWPGFVDAETSYLTSTLGNTFLASVTKRDGAAVDWAGFKSRMLPYGVDDEISGRLSSFDEWGAGELRQVARELASVGRVVWYGSQDEL